MSKFLGNTCFKCQNLKKLFLPHAEILRIGLVVCDVWIILYCTIWHFSPSQWLGFEVVNVMSCMIRCCGSWKGSRLWKGVKEEVILKLNKSWKFGFLKVEKAKSFVEVLRQT
jgi:hypothetical protein